MKKLLICDLDNTLYDWVGYFVPSFYALVDQAEKILDCDREDLLDDFRLVHQQHHDTEHPFALLETGIVKRKYRNLSRRELAAIFDSAFHAFNSTRKQTLHLYPGVSETLSVLEEKGIVLVAHTEGKLYSVLDRLKRLDILQYFSRIYCRERSSVGHIRKEVGERWLDGYPMQKITELSLHQRKPSRSVLLEILESEGVEANQSVYVGDSIARDMMMAKSVGVKAVWAKYGTMTSAENYAALVRISHWTKDDIEREIQLKEMSSGLEPDYVLQENFSEIRTCFE